jgi:hypothetical protein
LVSSNEHPQNFNNLDVNDLILHKSCETLPIFSFDKILNTNDYRYLIKGYFGEDDNKYKNFNKLDIGEKIFTNILNEFTLLTSDLNQINNIKKKILILELEYKYDTTTCVLNLYNLVDEVEVLWLLSDIGWSINKDFPYGPQIDKITKACIGLKNKINIHKSNYVNKYVKKETSQKKNVTLNKQAIYLQSNLELGYFLDTKICTVETWQNLQTLSKEKEAYYEKQKNINSRKPRKK